MASLIDYFDADFGYATRVYFRFKDPEYAELRVVLLYDFAGFSSFLSLYVPGNTRTFTYFRRLITSINYGESQLIFDNRITLPSARQFPGTLSIQTQPTLIMKAKFFGDPEEISTNQFEMSRRILLYSETQLKDDEIIRLKDVAKQCKGHHQLQFRSVKHMKERSKFEKPMAFISHDSRDKEAVGRPIALRLQKDLCPVWYDEFSLQVGDNLRDKIEMGLKECKKCIVVLSPNFFSNKGWTKKEFDSIFIREINEQNGLVLPVWYEVSRKDVYDYCPSLQNVVGLNWNELGEEEVCRRLVAKLLNE